MLIHVLGSGAGGGFPQWNCNCRMCAGVRSGQLRAKPRMQSSICVSPDGENWCLFNTSPDIRSQINSFVPLQPRRGLRDTGITAVFLMDSQIDHSSGLLVLREGDQPLPVYCTAMARQDLTSGLPLFNVMEHYCKADVHEVPIDGQSFTIPGLENLLFTAIALSSKAPPYSPHRHDPHPGDNIGVFIQDQRTNKSLFYAPGLGEIEAHLQPFMAQADCLLVDGTFWQEDEMRVAGVGTKPASAMGHLPQSGEGGMIEALRSFNARKVLIHINNTNPILDEDSAERAQLTAEGIEVADDGLDIEL
jgi:pyrroloquinoline quinone biosynthesis protein B